MAFNIFIWIFVVIELLVSTAWGWDYGSNRVQTSSEDSAACTGYGPGWVGLSYKVNGPVVGYLFGEGFQFSDGTTKTSADHMDIRSTANTTVSYESTSCCSNPQDITRWPSGYAQGGFGGCAYAYGTSKFAMVGDYSSSSCASGPSVTPESCSGSDPWWHSESIFCTDNGTDPLCSPEGVWSTCQTGEGPLTVYSLGCQAYGNIGAAGAYGSGSPVPQHRLGDVPYGEKMDLRYVTKDRQYVMAKWHSGNLTSCIEWAFFPRSCVSQSQPSGPQPGGCGGDSCGMGSCRSMPLGIAPEGSDRENSSCHGL